MKEKTKTILVVVAIIVIICLIFKNIPMKKGYYAAIYDFTSAKEGISGKIELSMPMFSNRGTVDVNNDINTIYTVIFKNARSKWIIKREIEEHLTTYEKTKCNNKEYYFNSTEGYTIIEHSIKNKFLYNEITYKFVFGNYCK